jgi:hypothetical protein
MSSQPDPNHAVEMLLDGIAPERKAELRQLWESYRPQFRLASDDRPGELVLEGGPFGLIRFNHRTMRLFWLGSYIAWEGYTAAHSAIMGSSTGLRRFIELINTFNQILAHENPAAVPLPNGIPEPGSFPSIGNAEERAPAEIAVFCAGWALLHEFRHIKHREDGTAAPPSAASDVVHAEEYSCDEYATKFMLEHVPDYAGARSQPEETVRLKRQLGIYFALFTIALLTRDRWNETASHPALQERVRVVRGCMGSDAPTFADAIAFAAFLALRQVFPNAPDPFGRDKT